MLRIRLMMTLQLIAFFSIIWTGLRDVAFPGGTTPTQALIIFILLVVWEDISRIQLRLDD